MGLIAFLLFGLVAGFIARFLVPGRDPIGLLGTLLLGIAGAFLGGFLFGGPDDRVGYIGAVVGAVILLVLYNLVSRRRTA